MKTISELPKEARDEVVRLLAVVSAAVEIANAYVLETAEVDADEYKAEWVFNDWTEVFMEEIKETIYS